MSFLSLFVLMFLHVEVDKPYKSKSSKFVIGDAAIMLFK